MQTVSTIGLDIAKSVFSNGTMSGISKRVVQGFFIAAARLGAP